MYNLTGKNIVLGVTGSIAAYKAVDLASKLTQAGAIVDVLLTEDAARFVAPLSFAGVTGRPADVDVFAAGDGSAEKHVELGRRADVLVIAPATATTIARLALGLAEDMVSLTALATRAPLVICPAMDSLMYEHVSTQSNLQLLQARGALIVGPEIGRLASGQAGPGRLSETSHIIGAVRYVLGQCSGDLLGRRIVVTAGGTQEPIDPVRYLGNYSSGRMGYALAEAARDRGAEVALVSAPSHLEPPYGVKLVPVRRALEMRDSVLSECRGADILIMAAAVADYQPDRREQKIKREAAPLLLELTPTPDILAELKSQEGLVKVGFAAESRDLLENARSKLLAKGLDLIVANDITKEGSGFGTETNEVVLLDKDGGQVQLPLLSKYEVAQHILDKIKTWLDRS
ncbi:MAG TPA: bifunctional phosphopantothenoylcysteine decarboxylase/phosphopantothenate--cysteine ligase CoaBC [Dehalococcoidia bacterium]|nr:bifunctional phosphopantothenoylcysteine decarboxylase/phosphopantothenate--cysteine ligase CoaBC [Dehalococcoidia bacterium]